MNGNDNPENIFAVTLATRFGWDEGFEQPGVGQIQSVWICDPNSAILIHLNLASILTDVNLLLSF